MSGPLILVTGGARSGKSRLAEQLAGACGGRVGYIATCQPEDEEMRERVARHRRDRPQHWETFEEALDPEVPVRAAGGRVDALLLDCLTLWLTNCMLVLELDDDAILARADRLAAAAHEAPCTVIVVTNEVGAGIVPEHALARRFRDLAGRVNQLFAARADEVYAVIAGLPLRLKPPAGGA